MKTKVMSDFKNGSLSRKEMTLVAGGVHVISRSLKQDHEGWYMEIVWSDGSVDMCEVTWIC